MTAHVLSSLHPMLAAPWRQRRNTTSMWGTGFFVFMVLLGPMLAFAVGELAELLAHRSGRTALQMADDAQFVQVMRQITGNVTAVALSTLAYAWWAVAVGNLLDQNRAVLARLVPGHPFRLRVALVVGWILALALTVVPVAAAFGHPLLCAVIAGPVLAFVANALRWPGLWVAATVMGLGFLVGERFALPLYAAVREQWVEYPAAFTATVMAACVVALVGTVQAGGRRHIANDQVQRARRARFQMSAVGQKPMAGPRKGIAVAVMNQPYYAWWSRAVRHGAGSAFERMSLGLGPGMHWSSLLASFVGSVVTFGAFFVVLELAMAWFGMPREVAFNMLGFASAGLALGLLSSAFQVQARLHQTRREQALLMLLPGVPQGPALSRGLAWRFSAQFALAIAGTELMVLLCRSALHVVLPEADSVLGWLDSLASWLVIALLPMSVILWRPWSRLGMPSPMGAMLPFLFAGIILVAIALGENFDAYSSGTVALVVLLPAAAWCAFRWRRMARETRSLPAGQYA